MNECFQYVMHSGVRLLVINKAVHLSTKNLSRHQGREEEA